MNPKPWLLRLGWRTSYGGPARCVEPLVVLNFGPLCEQNNFIFKTKTYNRSPRLKIITAWTWEQNLDICQPTSIYDHVITICDLPTRKINGGGQMDSLNDHLIDLIAVIHLAAMLALSKCTK